MDAIELLRAHSLGLRGDINGDAAAENAGTERAQPLRDEEAGVNPRARVLFALPRALDVLRALCLIN